MSALTRFFFTPVDAPRSAWTVVNWWESRRAIYNVSVGTAGLLSLAALSLATVLPPRPGAFEIPLPVVVLYAVMANACDSLGPVLDVIVPLAAMSWLARVLGIVG